MPGRKMPPSCSLFFTALWDFANSKPVHFLVLTSVETVTSFKYLGSVRTDEGSKPEILTRIALPTAALTRVKPVWNDRSVSLSSRIRLMRSLVSPIFLHVCKSWTLTAELQRRILAVEMRCYRNEELPGKIQRATGPHEDLLTIVKRRKLRWHGHVFRSSGLAKTILQGTKKGGRRQGRQKTRWEDNIREWTIQFWDFSLNSSRHSCRIRVFTYITRLVSFNLQRPRRFYSRKDVFVVGFVVCLFVCLSCNGSVVMGAETAHW